MKSKIITIFSNKGGVGKTFIAVNLSVALSVASRKKVLLLDFDFLAGQDIARMLNIKPGFSMVDTLEELEKPSASNILAKYVTAHSSGIDFLRGVSNSKQARHIQPENIRSFLKAASNFYDYIVVDAGKTLSEVSITTFDFSNLILLVVTPDIISVYQTLDSLNVLQSLHFPLKMMRVILNRAESRGGFAGQEVKKALPCEIFSYVPSDGSTVGMAINRGVPCVLDSPKSKIAESFSQLAQELLKDTIYVERTEVVKVRETDEIAKPSDFWEKLGFDHQRQSYQEVYAYTAEEEDRMKLKKKIHEKLVDKLELHRMTPEMLSNPRQSKALRHTTEKIVSDLLTEEAGVISSHEERMRLVKEISDETLGFGPLEEFLADAEVSDIMVNNKDEVYIEKHGKMIFTSKRFISNEQVRSIIERIIAPLGRRIDESVPMVDARLPDGSRINAIIPPLSLNGPMLTIRKFGKERLTIEDLLQKHNSLTPDMAEFLQACVLGRKNMIISGGTGSGKTTLLNVISQFIPDSERIITIEDAAELKLKKSHWGRLESRPANVEGKGEVSIRDLFVNTLRMRPDRIIIGECRGGEVLDMLQAMNTGHDGSLTTLHANSPRDVLIRLSSLMLLSGVELPLRAMQDMIGTAIHLIVHIARFPDGTRKITGVSEVLGTKEDHELNLRDIFVFIQTGIDADGKTLGRFEPTGELPECFEELASRGIPLRKEIFLKKSA